jgi:hypothetical protein
MKNKMTERSTEVMTEDATFLLFPDVYKQSATEIGMLRWKASPSQPPLLKLYVNWNKGKSTLVLFARNLRKGITYLIVRGRYQTRSARLCLVAYS